MMIVMINLEKDYSDVENVDEQRRIDWLIRAEGEFVILLS